jgi:membrane protein
LKQIFGANNVVNYNDPAYKEYSNYWYFYDPAHYNTKVGSKILYDLYRNDKAN